MKKKETAMPASVKAKDKKMDKAKGVKEGSRADLKMDKALAKKFQAKQIKNIKKGRKEMY